MANVRAPDLDFSVGTRPRSIPVSAPVGRTSGPIVLAADPSVEVPAPTSTWRRIPQTSSTPDDAKPVLVAPPNLETDIRAPNLDFSIGVRPRAIPVNPGVSYFSGDIVLTPTSNTQKAAPRLSLWGSGGGGGGGGTSSYPIAG